MLKVRDGEVGHLGVLFERYNGMLFNFFLRMTGKAQLSEDLVQEVFMRMLRYRHTYRDNGNFTTWMYKIARHVRFDDLRKHRHEATLDGEEEKKHISRMPIPGEQMEKDQDTRFLHAALSQLPADKREILILSRFQYLKYEEIAELLGCEVGAVKVRVFRAIRELRETFIDLVGEKAS